MLRARLAIVVLIASVVAGVPGLWPQALTFVPLAAHGGDAWHTHRAERWPLATAALRSATDTGRLTRCGPGSVLPSGHVELRAPFAIGAAQSAREGRLSSLRRSPSPARAPPTAVS